MKKTMKPRDRKFAQLYATGLYSASGAMREAGCNPASSSTVAGKALKRKEVKQLIKQIQDEDERLRALDGEYVRQQLAKIAHKTEASGQYTEALSALDKLGKAHGVYEKDNIQKAQVNLSMEF